MCGFRFTCLHCDRVSNKEIYLITIEMYKRSHPDQKSISCLSRSHPIKFKMKSVSQQKIIYIFVHAVQRGRAAYLVLFYLKYCVGHIKKYSLFSEKFKVYELDTTSYLFLFCITTCWHVLFQIIFVALALVAIASAAPSEKKPPVEIISFSSETNPDGSYNYRYCYVQINIFFSFFI